MERNQKKSGFVYAIFHDGFYPDSWGVYVSFFEWKDERDGNCTADWKIENVVI